MKTTSTQTLARVALLIAANIVLTRFFSISLPIVRIGFGFLPIALIAMRYGAAYAGIGGAIADFIGATLFPTGAFFPGFTLSAFLTGTIYGVFLYNRPKTILRISAAVIIISVFVHFGLNTLWLQMITGKGYLALLPTRTIKVFALIPVEIALIRLFADERILARHV